MAFSLSSFQVPLQVANDLWSQVVGRDHLNQRPALATKAVARRLRSGLAVLEALVRRILIVMALALEPELEHRVLSDALPPRRKAGKIRLRRSSIRFAVLPPLVRFVLDTDQQCAVRKGGQAAGNCAEPAASTVLRVPLQPHYARLDHLKGLLEDPLPKARRLAYYLARSRPGPIIPSKQPRYIANRWGTEASALYDALGDQIRNAYPGRPPPRAPRRRHLCRASITRL